MGIICKKKLAKRLKILRDQDEIKTTMKIWKVKNKELEKYPSKFLGVISFHCICLTNDWPNIHHKSSIIHLFLNIRDTFRQTISATIR
jgi:hypothetical protein